MTQVPCTFLPALTPPPSKRSYIRLGVNNSIGRTPGTLRNTFIHIPGVGYSTERHLWESGAQTWEEFRQKHDSLSLRTSLAKTIVTALEDSEESLRERDHTYFARSLPTREYWRAYSDFKHETAYLDIETTGLDMESGGVTVVGLYDGHKTRSFVHGDNLEAFPAAVKKFKVLVTFNGARFDVPFLKAAFKDLEFDQIHIDLRYPLRRLGFVGGLKAIEKRVGIERSANTRGLSGWDAVRLWKAHERGESGALETLIEYNAEDVVNLETLIDLSYCTLKTIYLKHGFTSGDEWRDGTTAGMP